MNRSQQQREDGEKANRTKQNLFLKFCVHFRRLESGCRIVCEKRLFDEAGGLGTLSISLLFRLEEGKSPYKKTGINRPCLNLGAFLNNLPGPQNTGKWNTLRKEMSDHQVSNLSAYFQEKFNSWASLLEKFVSIFY